VHRARTPALTGVWRQGVDVLDKLARPLGCVETSEISLPGVNYFDLSTGQDNCRRPISLRKNDGVRHGELMAHLRVPFGACSAINDIKGQAASADLQVLGEILVTADRIQTRGRIGQTRGFEHDAFEPPAAFACVLAQQLEEELAHPVRHGPPRKDFIQRQSWPWCCLRWR